MRMWCVDPKLLCRKHLLGEHVETHMFAGAIKHGQSLNGYIKKGLFNTTLKERHDLLAEEMVERGYNHNSPLDIKIDFICLDNVDARANVIELASRCSDCRKRIISRRAAKHGNAS